MTANQIQTESFSTAFTAPGYDHAWSEKQAGLRRRAALHDIERLVAPRRMFDSWAPDEERKQLGAEHEQRVQQFEHAVRHESPELGHDATGWDVEHHWYGGMRHALTMGHLSIDEAERRGFRGGEIDSRESGTKDSHWDEEQDRHVHTRQGGWQPLPKQVIHVTTDVPAVQREGLKTPSEQKIKGEGSIGLGGASDTVSVTSDHSLGPDIYHALHEHHAVVTGKIPIDHLLHYAAHPPVGKPFEAELRSQFQPEAINQTREGVRIHTGTTHPDDSHDWTIRNRHEGEHDLVRQWQRPATEEEKHEDRSWFYKSFSMSRHLADGHRDPLFISNDPHRFAQADPQHFAILHLKSHDGAQGYPLNGSGEHHSGADSGEWRLGRGSPFDVQRVEKPEPRHLREFGLSRDASRQGDRSVCPCGTPVVYDEVDGWEHADGSISHDGEFSDESVSDLMSRTAARFTPHQRVFGPTCGLDHRLFDNEHLRPEVRSDVIGRFTAFCARRGYREWSKWAKLVFFGSEASEWTSMSLEGNGDFDLSLGVNYPIFRQCNPAYTSMTDQEIANMFTQQMHADLNDSQHYFTVVL